jgi:hypothetical protein
LIRPVRLRLARLTAQTFYVRNQLRKRRLLTGIHAQLAQFIPHAIRHTGGECWRDVLLTQLPNESLGSVWKNNSPSINGIPT